MRRLAGSNADLDLRAEQANRSKQGKNKQKEPLDASDSAKLARMFAADGQAHSREASNLKCVTLIYSENAELLLEAEFSKTKPRW